MVRIKLKRIGKKKNPFYNVVVMEKLSYINGRYIDKVGYFDPLKKNIKINILKINNWIKNGAQPSNSVKKLIKLYKN